MKKSVRFAVAVLAVLMPVAAHAQATRTWVSGIGNDADPCSRTAPCKTFAGAISQTTDNGEINCIDPGGYGQVTITKNLTIDCGGTFGSGLAGNTNGIVVSNPTTSTVLHVVVRNLVINGTSSCVSPPTPGCLPAGPGLNGIRFLVSGSLTLDNVTVENFTSGSAGNGLDFASND